MNCITIAYEPFVLQQQIFVIKNDVCVEQLSSDAEHLNKCLKLLKEKYNINEIKINNSQFLKGIIKELSSDFNIIE